MIPCSPTFSTNPGTVLDARNSTPSLTNNELRLRFDREIGPNLFTHTRDNCKEALTVLLALSQRKEEHHIRLSGCVGNHPTHHILEVIQ